MEDSSKARLENLKRCLLVSTAIILTLLKGFCFFVVQEPLMECVLEWLFGMAVCVVILHFSFRYIARVREQAEEALKRRLEQLASLNRASQAMATSLELDQVLAEIVSLAGEVAASDYAGVVLVDGEGKLSRSVEHLPGVPAIEHCIRADGFTNWIIRSHQAVVVDEVNEDGTVNPRPANGQGLELEDAPRTVNPLLVEAGVRSFIGLPLMAKDRLLGVLYLHSLHPANFCDQLPLLTTFANQAAVAIEKARLYQSERKRALQLALVSKIAQQAASILNINQLLPEVVTAIRQSFNYYHVGLFLLDETAGKLRLRAMAGGFAEVAPPDHHLALGEGIAGWVAQTGRSLLVNDVSREPRYVLGILEEALTKAELCVPLKPAGKVIGVLDIQSTHLNAFDETDLMALEILADQIAMAIENAQLFEETKHRLEEMTALYQTSLDITARLEVPELLKSIVERAVTLLHAETGGILLYEPEREELRGAIGYGYIEQYAGITLKPGEGIAGKVFQTGEPFIVNDYQSWEGKIPLHGAELPFTAVLEVPLKWHGQAIGVLIIATTREERTFDQDDLWLATLFANQAAVALENARLYQETVRRLKETETLRAVSATLARSLDLDQVLQAILDSAVAAIPAANAGTIHLTDERRKRLIPKAASNRQFMAAEMGGMPLGQGIAGLAWKEKRIIQVADVSSDPRFITLGTNTAFRSLLVAPLMMGERCLGTISLHSNEINAFTPNDERLLSALASQAAVAVENAQLYEKVTERMREATLLHKVSDTLMRTLNLKQLLENILEVLQKAFGYSHCAILLPDEETGELCVQAARGYLQERRIEIDPEGIANWVATNKVPLNVPDVTKDKRYAGGTEIRAEIAVPMLVGRQLVGVLDVQSTEVNAFSEDDLRTLSSVAAQAAIAIERARLFQEAHRRSQEQATLFQASAAVLSTLHTDEVLREVAKQMTLAIDATSARVCRWNEAERTVTIIAEYIAPHASQKEQVSVLGTVYPVEDSRAFQVLQDHQPLVVSLADPEIGEDVRTRLEEFGGNTILYLPLAVRERVIGYVEVWESRRRRYFTQEEINLCQTISNQAAIAIENARLFAAEESSRRKMEAVIQNMTEGLLIIDTQCDIILANQRALELLDVTTGEMTGQNLLAICPYPSLNALVREALERELHTTTGEINIEETGRCDLGVTIAPFIQDGGQTLWYVLLHDITHLKELDRMKSDFVSNVSHDLRTPLANIKLYAALARKGRPEKRQHYLATIESETERLEALIEDILDLSRLERGAVELQVEPLPLSEIIQQVIGAHLATAQAKGIELTWEVADGLPPLRADRNQLLLMLNNLLGNALQYTPRGGSVQVEAWAGEWRGQPALHIAVCDTGIGIPADEQERIFERFYRGRHTPAGTTGTGLGLAIVKESMALHGGEVTVESTEGEGSTFTLCFPLEMEANYA